MRLKRLYLMFCLSSFTFFLCFWHMMKPLPNLDRITGASTASLRILQASVNIRQGCPENISIEIPFDLGDPCTNKEAARFLKNHLKDEFICPTSAKEYFSEHPIFNSAVSVKPKIVVTPKNINDIAISLQLAKQQDLTVTIKDGGHNPAGFSMNQDGMVIDMAKLKGVHFVDEMKDMSCQCWTLQFPPNAIVAEGGTIWKDVHPKGEERNLGVIGGGCPTVGVAGLAVSGGISWISRNRGLVSENVLAYRIVLPDGQVKVVTEQSDPDLMWALGGAGGSNFGVVTDVVLQTFPLEQESIFAGSLRLERKVEKVAELIDLYVATVLKGNLDRRATCDMFVGRTLTSERETKTMISIEYAAMFDGPIDEGTVAFRPFLDGLADLITTQEACEIKSMTCSSPDEMQRTKQKVQEWIRKGGPFKQGYTFYEWEGSYGYTGADVNWISGTFDDWTSENTLTFLENFKYVGIETVPEGYYLALVQGQFEHLGGAMAESKAAWNPGHSIGMVSLIAIMQSVASKSDVDDAIMVDDILKRWMERSYASLDHLWRGAYVGYANPDAEDWKEKYYGDKKYDRLVEIKSRIKGTEIFDSPQRIEIYTSIEPIQNGPLIDSYSENYRLARSKLQSKRSDLCPDWLLETAVSVSPAQIFPLPKHSSEGNASVSFLESMSFSTIRNKTVVITGGTRGIGFAAVLHLMRLGANVIATSQTTSKCQEISAKVYVALFRFSSKEIGTFTCMAVAFDDIQSIDQLVASLKSHLQSQSTQIDVLILNAAHSGPGWAQNMNGISKSIAVNHLGQFYLTLLTIQNKMICLKSGRILVQSSSAAHFVEEKDLIDLTVQRQGDLEDTEGMIRIDERNPSAAEDDPSLRTYCATKAMNVAFALELARRLRSTKTHEGLRVFLTLPAGTVKSDLMMDFLSQSSFRSEMLKRQDWAILSPAEGALSCVYGAVASLDILDYPPLSRYVTEEDFANPTKEEMLGLARPDRRLSWEYQKRQQSIGNYVLGCQVGSIGARFRNIQWLRTNTTCNLWNWSVEVLNDATSGGLHVLPGQGPLGDFYVGDCQSFF